MSDNNTTNPNCGNVIEGNPITVYIFAVLIPDIVSSLVNLILTILIYHTVEIHHPQFAVIFQNHCFGNVINLISLGLHICNALIHPIACFTSVYTILNYNALQFHFISWLSVAIIRLYLLSNQENDTLNFSKLKKCALAFVWTFFIVMKISLIGAYQLDLSYISLLHKFTSISPVFICILIYVMLKIKLKHNEELENLQHINRNEENLTQDEHENELEQVIFGYFV